MAFEFGDFDKSLKDAEALVGQAKDAVDTGAEIYGDVQDVAGVVGVDLPGLPGSSAPSSAPKLHLYDDYAGLPPAGWITASARLSDLIAAGATARDLDAIGSLPDTTGVAPESSSLESLDPARQRQVLANRALISAAKNRMSPTQYSFDWGQIQGLMDQLGWVEWSQRYGCPPPGSVPQGQGLGDYITSRGGVFGSTVCRMEPYDMKQAAGSLLLAARGLSPSLRTTLPEAQSGQAPSPWSPPAGKDKDPWRAVADPSKIFQIVTGTDTNSYIVVRLGSTMYGARSRSVVVGTAGVASAGAAGWYFLLKKKPKRKKKKRR